MKMDLSLNLSPVHGFIESYIINEKFISTATYTFIFPVFCFHHVIIVLFNNISVYRWVSFVNALTPTKVPKVIKDAK